MKPKYRDIVDQYIGINAFAAHPENLLIAMLVDERIEVRQTAVGRILQARKSARSEESEDVRVFKIPPLNFKAQDYTQLIFWDKCDITEPPILSHLSNDDICTFVDGDPSFKQTLSSFPCHTQAVERCVKLVTETCSHVVGSERRDGYIRSVIEDRKTLPRFDSKS